MRPTWRHENQFSISVALESLTLRDLEVFCEELRRINAPGDLFVRPSKSTVSGTHLIGVWATPIT